MANERTNEHRADLGEVLMRVTADIADMPDAPAQSVLALTLDALAHACDRYGVVAEHIFRAALQEYRRDERDGPAVECRYGPLAPTFRTEEE